MVIQHRSQHPQYCGLCTLILIAQMQRDHTVFLGGSSWWGFTQWIPKRWTCLWMLFQSLAQIVKWLDTTTCHCKHVFTILRMLVTTKNYSRLLYCLCQTGVILLAAAPAVGSNGSCLQYHVISFAAFWENTSTYLSGSVPLFTSTH